MHIINSLSNYILYFTLLYCTVLYYFWSTVVNSSFDKSIDQIWNWSKVCTCNTHGFPIVMHVRTYGFRRDSYESIHE
jgi:hypothetical protein